MNCADLEGMFRIIQSIQLEEKKMKNVFFIHGMFANYNLWKNIIPHLESLGKDCKYHPITLPFHDSIIQKESLGVFSVQDYVQFILDQIDGYENVSLVGISMGGLLSLLTSTKTDIDKAILINPAMPSDINNISLTNLTAYKNILFTKGFWNKGVSMNYKGFRNIFLENLEEEDARKTYDTEIVGESGKAIFQIAFPFLDSTNATKVDYGSITGRTCIVSSRKDRCINPKCCAKLQGKIRGSELQYFDGGHTLTIEKGWRELSDYIWVQL